MGQQQADVLDSVFAALAHPTRRAMTRRIQRVMARGRLAARARIRFK
jgi:hypothetical protein